MAGCKSSLTGEDFYGAYDAQNLAKERSSMGSSIQTTIVAQHAIVGDVNVIPVPSLDLVYTEEEDYVTADRAKASR
jgi:sulfate adenylyltransferase